MGDIVDHLHQMSDFYFDLNIPLAPIVAMMMIAAGGCIRELRNRR